MKAFWAATAKIMYTNAPFDRPALKARFIVEICLSGIKSQSQVKTPHAPPCHCFCGGSGSFISR
jgi:hypothetical protein